MAARSKGSTTNVNRYVKKKTIIIISMKVLLYYITPYFSGFQYSNYNLNTAVLCVLSLWLCSLSRN